MDSRIRAILDHTHGPAVLDVGCAGGLQTDAPPLQDPDWVHGHLVRSFEEVCGIDLAPERIDMLQRNGYPNVSAADAQAFDLGRTFDTIVAGEMIQQLPSPGLFLERCRAHLGADGRVVITTPYPFGYEVLAYAWLKYPTTCPNPEHTMWLCPRTMLRLAEVCDFRVEHQEMLRTDKRAAGFRPYAWAVRVSRFARHFPERFSGTSMLYVLRPA